MNLAKFVEVAMKRKLILSAKYLVSWIYKERELQVKKTKPLDVKVNRI